MARVNNNSVWKKIKYWINALLLLLPAWFWYQSQHPSFPAMLAEKEVGPFKIAAMPYDKDAPYTHDGEYVKDFLLIFNQGQVAQVRQAYLNIGPAPLSLEEAQTKELGVLHGTAHGQHVHALSQANIVKSDKIWLTLETWQGERHQVAWSLPDEFNFIKF